MKIILIQVDYVMSKNIHTENVLIKVLRLLHCHHLTKHNVNLEKIKCLVIAVSCRDSFDTGNSF